MSTVVGRVQATAVTDEFVTAEGSVVLLGSETSQAVRLSLLGAAIRELSAAPVTLDDLGSRLEGRFGPAPEGALAQLLAELIAVGVIEQIA